MQGWKIILMSGFTATEATCAHVQQESRPTVKTPEVYLRKDERKGIFVPGKSY